MCLSHKCVHHHRSNCCLQIASNFNHFIIQILNSFIKLYTASCFHQRLSFGCQRLLSTSFAQTALIVFSRLFFGFFFFLGLNRRRDNLLHILWVKLVLWQWILLVGLKRQIVYERISRQRGQPQQSLILDTQILVIASPRFCLTFL